MKCRECGCRIQKRTEKKNVGKCNPCFAREKKIAKSIRQQLEMRK